MTMTFPTVHLNGTSAETLIEGYCAARTAVMAAQDALAQVEFNARDYYVKGPEAYPAARKEHTERLQTLGRIADELLQIAMNVQDQQSEREERKAGR